MAEFNIFEELFNAIGSPNIEDPSQDGMSVLGSILALEPDKFEIVKNSILQSIDESFNTTEVRIALSDLMSKNNVTVEDLTASLEQLNKQIDEMDEPEFNDSKKDFLKRVFASFMNSMMRSNGLKNRIVQIPIEFCREGAKLPQYSTTGSAAMDIYAPDEYVIQPGETIVIPTGLKVAIPTGYALLVQPRSGLSRRTKLRIPNSPGLIDSDYHEEIGVIVENIDPLTRDVDIDPTGKITDLVKTSGQAIVIGKGERFAQMRLIEVPLVSWFETKSLGEFENDHGAGFGSTGKD